MTRLDRARRRADRGKEDRHAAVKYGRVQAADVTRAPIAEPERTTWFLRGCRRDCRRHRSAIRALGQIHSALAPWLRACRQEAEAWERPTCHLAMTSAIARSRAATSAGCVASDEIAVRPGCTGARESARGAAKQQVVRQRLRGVTRDAGAGSRRTLASICWSERAVRHGAYLAQVSLVAWRVKSPCRSLSHATSTERHAEKSTSRCPASTAPSARALRLTPRAAALFQVRRNLVRRRFDESWPFVARSRRVVQPPLLRRAA